MTQQRRVTRGPWTPLAATAPSEKRSNKEMSCPDCTWSAPVPDAVPDRWGITPADLVEMAFDHHRVYDCRGVEVPAGQPLGLHPPAASPWAPERPGDLPAVAVVAANTARTPDPATATLEGAP